MNMRIGGLTTGMDIDQLVSEMMRAERTKVDTITQDKTLLSWRQEVYQEVNRLLANFILDSKKDWGLTQLTSAGTLLSSGVNSLDWVKSATISNEDLAQVQAATGAVAGTYQLKVSRLASNWSAASSAAVSVGDKANLATQFGLADTDELNFTITTNLGSVNIHKTDLSSVSLNDVIKEINQANIGVTALYDAELDRFFLQTKNTGSSNTIQISDQSVLSSGGNFLTGSNNTLKLQYLDDGGAPQELADSTAYSGVDALFDFGAATGLTQSSNTFTLNNVTFTLKETGKATLNVATNVQGIYAKINDFVQKYNEMLEKINGELSEKRYADYRPLTDAQRESMSDKQVEKWEEKAKSGLLRNDSVLARTLNSVRSGLYEKVTGITGAFAQLTAIGITTESYDRGSRGGKLMIDSAKLTKAIERDADGVLELLFKKPDSSLTLKQESEMTAAEIAEKRSQSGLITRLYDNVIAGMKDVISKAGPGNDVELYRSVNSTMLIDFVVEHGSISMLDRDMGHLDKRIDTLEVYLVKKENRYWSQFTAMEKAIQRMNQQSAWIAQQFGGLSS